MLTCDCTAATASGDTAETSLGTVTLPANAKRVVGVGIGSPSTASLTTLEAMTGYFKVVCSSIDVTPGKFPFTGPNIVGTGGCNCPFKIWPVDWSPAANAQITFYVCMDMAQTNNPTYRGFVVYEK